jgi:sugar/nucleoside kinase (ribokinase family)
MLRDLGSLEDFGPSDLTESDYALIENADYVCVFNWAGTRKFGTRLADVIFRRVKAGGKGKTYYDTADPTPNKDRISEVMENVLESRQVDILSLNENEAISYASLLSDDLQEQRGKTRSDELAMEAARVLAKHLSARIDLHTTAFSATFTRKSEVVMPAFKIRALRATGAGDAWNAGNIRGDADGFSDECRLALANAVSACYLSDPVGTHPTQQNLVKFIEDHA